MNYKSVEIIARIKDIMREKSISQKGLVEATGIVQSSVSAILNGKRNPDPLIKAMSDKMGICMEWLVNGVGFKYENSKYIANIENDISTCKNLSIDEKVELLKEMQSLYDKHQYLLQEAQNIMKTIVDINKKILICDC